MTTLSQTTIDNIINQWVEDNIEMSACHPITFRNANTDNWDWHLIEEEETPRHIRCLEDYFFNWEHECYGMHYDDTEEGVLLHNLNEERQIELRPIGKPHRVGLGFYKHFADLSEEELYDLVSESDYVQDNGIMVGDIQFVVADSDVLYAFFEDANQ